MIDWLKDNQVLICAGSGGVGKTTLSAALGVLAAREGLKVLVLTIDPARRLAGALGVKDKMKQEVEVSPSEFKGQLFACMIDPGPIFDEFIRVSAPNEDVAERLLKNRLYRELATTLNGSQEFTALEKLLQSVESKKYDLVILDTPPAQHAVEFLQAPERIFALFQETVTRWFIQAEQGDSFLQKIIHRGTRTVLIALERITGSTFIGELSDFFQNMSSLQLRVRERSQAVQKLMIDEKTGFILITGFDEAKLREAKDFLQDLLAVDSRLLGVIVNRSFPERLATVPIEEFDKLPQELRPIKGFYKKLMEYFSSRQVIYQSFQESMGNSCPVLRIPEMHENVNGVEALNKLADRLQDQWHKQVRTK